jgi:dUTPase
MNRDIIEVFKVSPKGLLPTRSTPLSARLDLFCCDDGSIAPGTRAAINIGISGYSLELHRPQMMMKHFLQTIWTMRSILFAGTESLK